MLNFSDLDKMQREAFESPEELLDFIRPAMTPKARPICKHRKRQAAKRTPGGLHGKRGTVPANLR
jgi:hypothetical protein